MELGGTWPMTMGPAPRSMIVLMSVRFCTVEVMFSHALKSAGAEPDSGLGGAAIARTICSFPMFLFDAAGEKCRARPPANALARPHIAGIGCRPACGDGAPTAETCICTICDAILDIRTAVRLPVAPECRKKGFSGAM